VRDRLVWGRTYVGTGAFARPGLGEARPDAAPRFSARDDLNAAALSAATSVLTRLGLAIEGRAFQTDLLPAAFGAIQECQRRCIMSRLR
jgi:hypothetical protein